MVVVVVAVVVLVTVREAAVLVKNDVVTAIDCTAHNTFAGYSARLCPTSKCKEVEFTSSFTLITFCVPMSLLKKVSLKSRRLFAGTTTVVAGSVVVDVIVVVGVIVVNTFTEGVKVLV